MRKVIHFRELMKEVYFTLDIHLPNPEVYCKVFEYNKSCIALGESNKFSPRKKNHNLVSSFTNISKK